MAINIIALLGLGGLSFYLYTENNDLNEQITLTTEEKNRRLIEEVNQVFNLPDEEPVVAIVTDPEEFKTQYPTFTDAIEGDYLLFFRKARLNVLYRQSEQKVVTTANVVVPIAVELVGSQDDMDAAQANLSEFGNQITVTQTVREGVTQSFVFDVDQDQSAETTSIADQLGIDVGSTLPTDVTPGAQTEVIILVGPTQAEAAPTTETSEN